MLLFDDCALVSASKLGFGTVFVKLGLSLEEIRSLATMIAIEASLARVKRRIVEYLV